MFDYNDRNREVRLLLYIYCRYTLSPTEISSFIPSSHPRQEHRTVTAHRCRCPEPFSCPTRPSMKNIHKSPIQQFQKGVAIAHRQQYDIIVWIQGPPCGPTSERILRAFGSLNHLH
jgi:hypothetical protein